jgi:hypothetical protein
MKLRQQKCMQFGRQRYVGLFFRKHDGGITVPHALAFMSGHQIEGQNHNIEVVNK